MPVVVRIFRFLRVEEQAHLFCLLSSVRTHAFSGKKPSIKPVAAMPLQHHISQLRQSRLTRMLHVLLHLQRGAQYSCLVEWREQAGSTKWRRSEFCVDKTAVARQNRITGSNSIGRTREATRHRPCLHARPPKPQATSSAKDITHFPAA